MTLKQYRIMDLAFFCVILAVTQTIITKAASGWFADQLYVVSPVAAVTAIVMMRWGGWAAVPAILGGAVLSLVSGGDWQQAAVYMAGNTASLGALLMLRLYGRKQVRDKTGRSLTFAALVQVLMLLGRMLAALIAGFEPAAAWRLVTTDTLSIVFTLVIVWIARRADGLFEDQITYLRRVQHEAQEEAAGGPPAAYTGIYTGREAENDGEPGPGDEPGAAREEIPTDQTEGGGPA